MTADEWLNERLLIDGMGKVKRKDLMGLSIPRQDFIRAIFIGIQGSVQMKIPDIEDGETVQQYRARVINAAMKSGATVITNAG